MQILAVSVHRIEVEDLKRCLPVCCDANTLLSLIEISELETNSLRTIPLGWQHKKVVKTCAGVIMGPMG